ncbi:glycosyltransferase [Ferrimicrobium sp.]|uniref:glycosyltransferase n=1 Tax=Ferrimicrobium sp. TaxID=2926050 RepID=UPI002638B6B9|nr:glycosyltransferase [Ferrimicrobium sp.]
MTVKTSPDQLLTVALVIPARNEAPRLPHVLDIVTSDPLSIFDDIIVVDDGSTDSTAAVAHGFAEVHVVSIGDGRPGKGKALKAGWCQTLADIIVTCDADLGALRHSQLGDLVQELTRYDHRHLAKAAYANAPDNGGRVTELVAKPLLDLFFPTCADLRSPLSGEMAFYREDIVSLDLPNDYGVDIAILLSLTHRYGRHAIAEVPFGIKEHPHQPLSSLSNQARQVIRAMLERKDSPYPDGDGLSALSLPSELAPIQLP